MIVTVSVVLGFKHTIRDKVVGFGNHIQVSNFASQQTAIPAPIAVSDSLMLAIKKTPNIVHVSRYALTQGILKTDSDFLGVVFMELPKTTTCISSVNVFRRDSYQSSAVSIPATTSSSHV